MKKSLILLLSLALPFACAAKSEAKIPPQAKIQASLPADQAFLQGYLDGVVALAKDDFATARTAFQKFESDARTAKQADLLAVASPLAAAADLKAQRRVLNAASVAVMRHAAKNGLDKAGVSFYHCPMSKQGGNWASLSGDVQNPYFGASMFECGEKVDAAK